MTDPHPSPPVALAARLADMTTPLVIGLEWPAREPGQSPLRLARERNALCYVPAGASVGLTDQRALRGHSSAAAALAAYYPTDAVVALIDAELPDKTTGYWYCLLTSAGVQRDRFFPGASAREQAIAEAERDRLILGETRSVRCLGHPPPVFADLITGDAQDAGPILRAALRDAPARLRTPRAPWLMPVMIATGVVLVAFAVMTGWNIFQAQRTVEIDPDRARAQQADRDRQSLFEAHTKGPSPSQFVVPTLAELARSAPPYLGGWRRTFVRCERTSAATPGALNQCAARYQRLQSSGHTVLELAAALDSALPALLPMSAASALAAKNTVLRNDVVTHRVPLPDIPINIRVRDIPASAAQELVTVCQSLARYPLASCNHQPPRDVAFPFAEYLPSSERFRLAGVQIVMPLYAFETARHRLDELPFLQVTGFSIEGSPVQSLILDGTYVIH